MWPAAGKELSNAPRSSANHDTVATPSAARAEYEQRVRSACYDRRRGDEAVVLLRDLPASALYGEMGDRGPPSERAFRNKALGWLSRRGQWQQALAAFEDDLKTSRILKSCASAASSESPVVETDEPYVSFPPDEYTWAAVLAACGEARPPQWRRALELLDRMQDEEEAVEEDRDGASSQAAAMEPQKSLEDQDTKVLSGNKKDLKNEAVLGVPLSAIHVGLAMKACSRAGRVQEVLELLQQTPVLTQQPPTLILWNQAVGACAAKGMLRVILDQLLPAMEEASSLSEYDVQPDVWTYNLALKATEVRGDVVGAKALMSAMTTSGIVKDVITYNTALGTAAASRSVMGTQWAFQLLKEMAPVGTIVVMERKNEEIARGKMDFDSSGDDDDEEGLAIPDNRTLCAAMSALGGSGQHWREAMDLLHVSLPSSPSIRVFNAALDAICAENGQVHLVEGILDLLSAGGLTPDRWANVNILEYTLNTVLKAYSKQGDVDTCIALLLSLNSATSNSRSSNSRVEKTINLSLGDERSENTTSLATTKDFPEMLRDETTSLAAVTAADTARSIGKGDNSWLDAMDGIADKDSVLSSLPPTLSSNGKKRDNNPNKKRKGRGTTRNSGSSVGPDGPGWMRPPSASSAPINDNIMDSLSSSRFTSGSSSSFGNNLASWFASHGLVPRARDFNVALDACQQRAADLALNRPMAARRGPLSDGRGIGEVRCSVLTKDGARLVAQVRELLEAMECANLVPDDYAYSAAIIACGRAGDPNAALQLFSEMEARAEAPVGDSSFSSLGSDYIEGDNDSTVLDSVSVMAIDDNSTKPFAPSDGLLSAAKYAAAAADDITTKTMNANVGTTAKKKKKKWKPRPPNPHCYRAALSVCQAYARAPEAKRLLRQLTSTRSATAVDYSYALQTCERAGDWQGAVEVVNEMQAYTVASSSSSGATKQSQQTQSRLDQHNQDDNGEEVNDSGDIEIIGPTPDPQYTQTTRLKGRSSVRAQALELLASQENLSSAASTSSSPRLSLDRATYEKERSRAINAAVVVCAGAGQWEAARSLIATMEKQHGKHAVNQVAYSATIEALVAAGELIAAIDLFDELVSAPWPPPSPSSEEAGEVVRGKSRADVVACGAAMEAAACLEDWEKCWHIFEETQQTFGLVATPHMQALAMQALRYMGNWQAALSLVEQLTSTSNNSAGMSTASEVNLSQQKQPPPSKLGHKEIDATTPSPIVATVTSLNQMEAAPPQVSRMEMVVVECALACAEAQANSSRRGIQIAAIRTNRTLGSTLSINDDSYREDGDDNDVREPWFKFGLPLLLAKLQPVPSAAALDALFYGLDSLLSLAEQRNAASNEISKWSNALYAALVESGRLPSCVVLSSSSSPSTTASSNSGSSNWNRDQSSSNAMGSSNSETPLAEVDLALCPSNRIASAALAYATASDFQVVALHKEDGESMSSRSSPYNGPVLVRAAGGGLQSQTRLAAAVGMLQSLEPPLLIEETSPCPPESNVASFDGSDQTIAAMGWQLGCQVEGDRIWLSANAISAWRAAKKSTDTPS